MDVGHAAAAELKFPGRIEMYKTLGAATIFTLVATIAAIAQPARAVPPEVIKDLAPTGTLRAAINAGNVVLVQKGASGVIGVTVDLAIELGRRLGTGAYDLRYRRKGN
jgi:hypothetical protein